MVSRAEIVAVGRMIGHMVKIFNKQCVPTRQAARRLVKHRHRA